MAIAAVGHNNPPSKIDEIRENADGLIMEANNWLDGDPVTDQKSAEAIEKLKKMIKDARIAAENARKEEKQPYLDAGKAVDAAWKPVVFSLSEAEVVCGKALTPWFEEQERKRQEEARKAREEQERLAAEQLAARAFSDDTNLEEVQDISTRADEIKKAEKTAKRAEKAAEKTAFRIFHDVSVTDLNAAVAHYLAKQPDAFTDLIETLAKREVAAGNHNIPGVTVTERKEVRK